ncbi:hypothetical protein GCM10029964_054910 [Kibdelosporangium lantanae]
MHAAGAVDTGSLDETSVAEFERVLAAKVLGALHLDELLGQRPLDAFVMFSSNAGVWGGGGQGAYAAANAFLDALALRRRADGRTATSVAWGLWAGSGHAATSDAREYLRKRGMRAMAPASALTALQQALDLDDTFVVVSDIEWARFAPVFTAGRPSPLLGDLPEIRSLAPADQPAPRASSAVARDLAGLDEAGRRRFVLDLVHEHTAALLGHRSSTRVDPGRPFQDLGFDSLAAVELRNRLTTATGLAVSTTAVFDHPTVTALADHLLDQLTGTTAASAAPAVSIVDDDPVVIVGMACRYPGGVSSPDDLWRLVAAGGDAIGPAPADRGWTDGDMAPGAAASLRDGGFLTGAAEFDAGFFGISPREALAMDPQQRLLLETSWEALEDAGIDPVSLRGSSTGVFAGTTGQDYASLFMAAGGAELEGYLSTGNAASVLSGRVAYTLGLEGPALTVDTACSSSLVALHLAGESLRRGECSLALASGVVVMATPVGFTEFTRQGALAPDGRCKAFAAAADGTGWAEGVGVLVLARLSDAERLGHPVLAVVRGVR